MKKILNWIVVIIVAFIITGLVCRAKIYNGMTEIKHIYNGMTPIYSIYDGPRSVSALGGPNPRSMDIFSLEFSNDFGIIFMLTRATTDVLVNLTYYKSSAREFIRNRFFAINTN